uniref:Bestrophin homolog n=2 Tax=Parascaris univalens TaxID=6257 RepID=A0A915AEA8_PARUN
MTISYNLDVATASPFNFLRIIFRWKGSIWKSCIKELCIWTILYLIVTFIYRTPYFLTDDQKIIFENIAYYFDTRLDYIPLTFMLGFFVQTIVRRWSVLFENMGYVESPAIYIGGYVYGTDDECRLLRRTMARYLCLTQLLVYRDISVRVRKRFPTYESIVKAGFMLEHEKEKLESIRLDFDKYWVPINWIYALIFRARKEGKVPSDSFANKLCDEIKYYRYNIQMLCNYDWVPIPLAYPQLVFLAVYVYFALCLISRQFIITERDAPNKSTIDLTLPFMTMMEFLILVGWMKVAEGLLNPFGEDDDDFECNFLLDKNLATALCIVDDASNDAPRLEKDRFWQSDEVEPMYSKETASQPINPLVGSATQAHISTEEPQMVVRKSTDASRRNSSRSYVGNLSKRWKFSTFTERFRRTKREAQNRPRGAGISKLFYSDVAINELEDGTQAESASQKRSGAKSSKYFSRQVSAFTVLDGHSSHGISTIYDPLDDNFVAPPLSRQQSRDGELLFHRGLAEIPIQRPSSLCSSRTPSNADSQKSISLMNMLSTVEEEDPMNLTVHQREDSKRGTICEAQSVYTSLMGTSKETNAEKVDESQDLLKNTCVVLAEEENKELLEKTSDELAGKVREELSGKGKEQLALKSSEELPTTTTETVPVKRSEESPEKKGGSLPDTSHRKARRLAFVNAAFSSTIDDPNDV